MKNLLAVLEDPQTEGFCDGFFDCCFTSYLEEWAAALTELKVLSWSLGRG